mmetsp:Transcript_79903/g.247901  ORF Transcript_79903/g.247901 Transcript_79903/m.247901 type:complete len:347 (+) Transcript_79903:268-1308(+)
MWLRTSTLTRPSPIVQRTRAAEASTVGESSSQCSGGSAAPARPPPPTASPSALCSCRLATARVTVEVSSLRRTLAWMMKTSSLSWRSGFHGSQVQMPRTARLSETASEAGHSSRRWRPMRASLTGPLWGRRLASARCHCQRAPRSTSSRPRRWSCTPCGVRCTRPWRRSSSGRPRTPRVATRRPTGGSGDPAALGRSWFGARRHPLVDELREELKEERRVGADLRTQLDAENKAAEATLASLAEQLQLLREQEAKLRRDLRTAQEEELASQQALGTLKQQMEASGRTNWRAVIEKQTQMLRKILEVAERLERREQQLRANLAKRKADNDELKADLKMAEELSRGAA